MLTAIQKFRYLEQLGNHFCHLWNTLGAEHGSHPARSAKDLWNYYVRRAGKEVL